MRKCVLVAQSCPTLLQLHGLQPARVLCPWDFPGKNTGVGCHFLLQGIFQMHRLNPGLLHCRQILYHLSHKGSSGNVKDYTKMANGQSILKIVNLQVGFKRKTTRYKIKVGWSQDILEPLPRFHRNFENNQIKEPSVHEQDGLLPFWYKLVV